MVSKKVEATVVCQVYNDQIFLARFLLFRHVLYAIVCCRYLDWPVARIRLLVARALPHLLTDRDSIRKFIHFLFNIILPASSSATEENTGPVMHASSFKLNAVHGALLTVKTEIYIP